MICDYFSAGWRPIYYFAFSLEILLGTTEQNIPYKQIMVTMGLNSKPVGPNLLGFLMWVNCRFNVVFRLKWRRDATQRQINVEAMLCTSTLRFTTFNNVKILDYVKTTLFISTLNWTTLVNVETTLTFSTSIFKTLGNVETPLVIWPFEKKG